MKVACTVWGGGKSEDNIKGLPITISDFLLFFLPSLLSSLLSFFLLFFLSSYPLFR